MSHVNIFANDQNLPPDVPEAFSADISDATILPGDIPASAGDAVAVAHKLRVSGDNGIKTIVTPNAPGNLTIRFIRGEATTAGAGTSTVITQAIPTNSSLTTQVLVAGYTDNNLAVGGYTTATVKNVAGVASLIDQGDVIVNTELAGANFAIGVSGGNLIVTVTNADAARTITWTAILPGVVLNP